MSKSRQASNRARGGRLQAWRLALLAVLMFGPGVSLAIDPSEVRTFDDVFRISAHAPSRDMVEVRWEIEPDYYLYNNKFLRFETATPGVMLGEPIIPAGEKKYDELLDAEVIKFHQHLSITLPLENVDPGIREITLRVRSQGCLESVLCYPPTEQTVRVTLPAEVAPLGDPLGLALHDPLQLFNEAADGKAEALAAADAFRYEAIGLSSETILVRFTVNQGYYLYRDKFEFRVLDNPAFIVREVSLPPGTIKDDPEFGPVPVYYGQVEIPVRLNRPAGPEQNIVLEADYQGCRDGDICYPPQTTAVELLLSGAAVATDLPLVTQVKAADRFSGTAPVSEQDRLARLLLENPGAAIFAFFVAGLLLAFTPCVFPMVPILSGIIAGQGERITTSRAFTLSLVYVLAMAVTYTIAGVLAGLFGQNLQAVFQNPWIISGFVAVFVLLALSMFGFYELQMPSRWQSVLTEQSNRHQGGNLAGVAVMGFLSALIVGPCVAPPLAAALIVIGSSGNPVLGGSALFSLSLGMGVPLILFGVSAGKLIPRAGAWMNTVKAVFGVGLLALGIWMLERIIPGPVILLLWGVLAIGSGVYLGALERIPEQAPGWRRLAKTLGLVLLVIGAAELIGAATGGNNWLRPLDKLGKGSTSDPARHVEFQRIKSVADLKAQLERSSALGRPAMLDFYADWCVECIRMERNTFVDPGVQGLLVQMSPLQADVTPNDAVDQALMKKFGVIGPPAILFFDRRGQEMRAYRLVGYFTPGEFSAHLQAVLAAP